MTSVPNYQNQAVSYVPCSFCRFRDEKVNLFKDLLQAGVAEQNYLYKLIKFWQLTKDQKQGIHIAT